MSGSTTLRRKCCRAGPVSEGFLILESHTTYRGIGFQPFLNPTTRPAIAKTGITQSCGKESELLVAAIANPEQGREGKEHPRPWDSFASECLLMIQRDVTLHFAASDMLRRKLFGNQPSARSTAWSSAMKWLGVLEMPQNCAM